MTFVRMMEVTIVQIVGVAAVTYRRVSTTRPMLVRMVGMGWGGASRHETASFRGFRCADAAARILRGDVYTSTVGKSEAMWQGDHSAHVLPRLSGRSREPLSSARGLVLS